MVGPDNLLSYNMLLGWWQHGNRLTGYTLTPSPYFVDLVLQFPIALIAPDFEAFAYGLGLAYALALLASLATLIKRAAQISAPASAVTAAACVASYYEAWPWSVSAHVFVQNHTSEIVCSFLLLSALRELFEHDDGAATDRRSWRRLLPAIYGLGVAVFVASSPFFIATFCVPSLLAAALVIGTQALSPRRYLGLCVLTVGGAVAGLTFDAWLTVYVMPIRSDAYPLTPSEAASIAVAVLSRPDIAKQVFLATVACVGCLGAAIWRRFRARDGFGAFVLAFVPCCALACVGLPIARGGFDSPYALRFLQLPLFLATSAVVFASIAIVYRASSHLSRRAFAASAALPNGFTWIAGIAAGLTSLVLVVAVAEAGMPFSIDDPRSTTAPMVTCFRGAERDNHLESGLATVVVARFINAARHARSWHSAAEIVQLERRFPPAAVSSENDSGWVGDGRWVASGALNFFATHGMTPDVVAYVRDKVGPPDAVAVCPVPADMQIDEKPTFEIWSWTRPDARARLTTIVTKGAVRAPFATGSRTTHTSADPVWGMYASPGEGALLGDRRVWRRGQETPHGELAFTEPLFLPAGRYRAHFRLRALARSGASGPVANAIVLAWPKVVADVPVRADDTAIDVDFSSANRGSTSGAELKLSLRATDDAERIELESIDIERLSVEGIDPLRIFK